MVEAGDVDLVQDVGMPDRFTPYTIYITFILSLTWVLAAIPAMVPAYVAPPASAGLNSTPMANFYTVIEEFDLDMHTSEWTTSAYFLGSLILGQIPCAYSDRIGRKPIVFWSALLTGVAGCIAAAAPNYAVFLFGRFWQGVFFTATTNVNWVMVCESVPLSCHGKASIVFGIMWVVGYCIIAPIAYFFPTWRMVFIVTSVPTILYAFLAKHTIRESLSFLVVRKRRAEVEAWIQKMEQCGVAKFEGGCLDRLLSDDGNSGSGDESPPGSYAGNPMNPAFHRVVYRAGSSDDDDSSASIWSMTVSAISERKTAIYLSISIYMWITDFLVYNGISMTSTGLKVGNPHWNYVMSGLVELPAAIVLPCLMDTIGRRWTVILSHAETAIALIAMCFISIENEVLYTFVWLLAKFGTASSFIALYIYGSEIFPIKYRNICLGICCTLGNVGAILAPYAAHLGLSAPWLVFLIYAGVSAGSSILDFWLPETLHKKNGHTNRSLED